MKTFIETLSKIQTAKNQAQFPQLIVLRGDCEVLVAWAIQALKSKWVKDFGSQWETLEARELSADDWQEVVCQTSLFGRNTFYALMRLDKSSALFKDPETLRGTSNRLILHFTTEQLPKAVQKVIADRQMLDFVCSQPKSDADFNAAVQMIAEGLQVKLTGKALQLLKLRYSNDLTLIINDLKLLSLMGDGKIQIIDELDVARHGSVLRDEHVFELFSLLRGRKFSEAQLLCDHLLDKGEQPLALLGILSKHIRDQVERSNQGRKTAGFAQSLATAAAIDAKIKSSRIDERLLLGLVLDTCAET